MNVCRVAPLVALALHYVDITWQSTYVIISPGQQE